MKRLLLAAVLAAMCVPAVAADLTPIVTKAPAIPTTFPLTTSGVFYGLYMAGAGGAADVKNVPAGINAASLTTTQGEIGGEIGYRWASANSMKFVDVLVDIGYQNLNGSTAGLSLSGPVAIEVGARMGVPMAAITSLFPSFNLASFPALPIPSGTSVLSTQAYIGGAARFEDISPSFGAATNTEWAISPVVMAGMIQALNNGTAIDARFEYIGAANKCVGPVVGACASMDHRFMAKAAMLF